MEGPSSGQASWTENIYTCACALTHLLTYKVLLKGRAFSLISTISSLPVKGTGLGGLTGAEVVPARGRRCGCRWRSSPAAAASAGPLGNVHNDARRSRPSESLFSHN